MSFSDVCRSPGPAGPLLQITESVFKRYLTEKCNTPPSSFKEIIPFKRCNVSCIELILSASAFKMTAPDMIPVKKTSSFIVLTVLEKDALDLQYFYVGMHAFPSIGQDGRTHISKRLLRLCKQQHYKYIYKLC